MSTEKPTQTCPHGIPIDESCLECLEDKREVDTGVCVHGVPTGELCDQCTPKIDMD